MVPSSSNPYLFILMDKKTKKHIKYYDGNSIEEAAEKVGAPKN